MIFTMPPAFTDVGWGGGAPLPPFWGVSLGRLLGPGCGGGAPTAAFDSARRAALSAFFFSFISLAESFESSPFASVAGCFASLAGLTSLGFLESFAFEAGVDGGLGEGEGEGAEEVVGGVEVESVIDGGTEAAGADFWSIMGRGDVGGGDAGDIGWWW